MINKIISLEWDMFSSVSNMGGQADCQRDVQTFIIMRNSQFQTWTSELLKSYLEDLVSARNDGVNLMTLKYARMMEHTCPSEYARLNDQLPPIDAKTMRMIDEIVQVYMAWDNELIDQYPSLRSRGRPANHQDDSSSKTSIETYMRGELSTYSHRSIAIYHQDTMAAKANGINLAELILHWTIRSYGYASLVDAERYLKKSN